MADSKSILIRTAGTDPVQEKEVLLAPGSRVADAIEQAGLAGFSLANPRGGTFNPGDDLYDAVAPGQKLFASKVEGLSAG